MVAAERYGRFCWVGLATSDPDSAKRFYARLFGWEAADFSGAGSRFTILCRGSNDVALLYRQTAEARAAGAPPHWTSFISVADARATAARAAALGGAAVFRAPFDVLDAGKVAAVRDPIGAMISLWQAGSRSGATLVDCPGAHCATELATSGLDRATSFYRELLGWDYEQQSPERLSVRGTEGGRIILRSSDPGGGRSPEWLPYFGVEDIDAFIREAESLGGRLISSSTDSSLGPVARLADLQGAAFGILER